MLICESPLQQIGPTKFVTFAVADLEQLKSGLGYDAAPGNSAASVCWDMALDEVMEDQGCDDVAPAGAVLPVRPAPPPFLPRSSPASCLLRRQAIAWVDLDQLDLGGKSTTTRTECGRSVDGT